MKDNIILEMRKAGAFLSVPDPMIAKNVVFTDCRACPAPFFLIVNFVEIPLMKKFLKNNKKMLDVYMGLRYYKYRAAGKRGGHN